MSNLRHEFISGFPYHVFNRGFEKQRIFFSDADFARFTARLQYLLDEHPHIHLHAFCLLPNHFHLILSETMGRDRSGGTGRPVSVSGSQPGGISAFMHKLELAYTMYAKTKYREEFPRGPFLEGRFQAKILEDERDVARCMSYVCYNAIKHELVTDIRDWTWTSYHQLVHTNLQIQSTKYKVQNEGILDSLPRVIPLEGVEVGEYVDIDEE